MMCKNNYYLFIGNLFKIIKWCLCFLRYVSFISLLIYRCYLFLKIKVNKNIKGFYGYYR